MSADELVRFLGPARISTYKEPWAEDQERSFQLQLWVEDPERNLQPQPPSITDLLSEVYRHWSGEAPRIGDWDELRFNVILEGTLLALNLAILKWCHEIEIG